jgi:hypothetical protein
MVGDVSETPGGWMISGIQKVEHSIAKEGTMRIFNHQILIAEGLSHMAIFQDFEG